MGYKHCQEVMQQYTMPLYFCISGCFQPQLFRWYLGVTYYICINWLHLHFDEAFSSLRIANYKSFTRFHITHDGDLEVIPLLLIRSQKTGSWIPIGMESQNHLSSWATVENTQANGVQLLLTRTRYRLLGLSTNSSSTKPTPVTNQFTGDFHTLTKKIYSGFGAGWQSGGGLVASGKKFEVSTTRPVV